MNILFVVKRELYAVTLENYLKEIDPEINIYKSKLGAGLEELMEERIYDYVFVANDLNINVDYMAIMFHKNNKDIGTILIADVLSENDVMHAVKYGVRGIISVDYSEEKVKCVLRLLMMGEKFFPKAIVGSVIYPLLTNKEIEILGKVKNGDSNKQIAFDLGLSESTIKAHLSKMFKKFNCYNRIQLLQKVHDFRNPDESFPNKY